MRLPPRLAQVGIVLVVGLALAITVTRGPTGLAEFLAAVLVDFVLSIDEVLVVPFIGMAFGLPAVARRRVVMLSLGVSLAVRVPFLLAGCALVPRSDGIGIALGVVMLASALRAANEEAPGWGIPILPWTIFLWVLPSAVNRNGVRHVAPILATMAAITCLHPMVLASEAMPAVLAVTTDPVVAIASTTVVVAALFVFAWCQDDEFTTRFWSPRHLHAAIVVLLFMLSAKIGWAMQLSPWLVVGAIASLLGAVAIDQVHADSTTTAIGS